MTGDKELLAIQLGTRFVLNAAGRIERTNDPSRSAAPRFFLAGCAAGNTFGIGVKVPDHIAAELRMMAADEPPFSDHGALPKHLDRYVVLLSRRSDPPKASFDVTYDLSGGRGQANGANIVASDTDAGDRLIACMSAEGLPSELLELGFRNDVSEFWAPWCAALHKGRIASLAFAARLSERGAELGVVTIPSLRGRGFAAAASAAWVALPSLRSHALFYSTDRMNISSRRVVARLGLRYIGTSMTLA